MDICANLMPDNSITVSTYDYECSNISLFFTKAKIGTNFARNPELFLSNTNPITGFPISTREDTGLTKWAPQGGMP